MMTTTQISSMMRNYLIGSNIKFKKHIGQALNKQKPNTIEKYFSVIIETIDQEFQILITALENDN